MTRVKWNGPCKQLKHAMQSEKICCSANSMVLFKQTVAALSPASVAHLDACPTGDQEDAGSSPCLIGNILL